jgi:hypothetical protein
MNAEVHHNNSRLPENLLDMPAVHTSMSLHINAQVNPANICLPFKKNSGTWLCLWCVQLKRLDLIFAILRFNVYSLHKT